MLKLINSTFESHGARGCSNSDYSVVVTSCCGSQLVHDAELDDIYFDPADPSAVRGIDEQACCPVCNSTPWNWQSAEWSSDFIGPWTWATEASPERTLTWEVVKHALPANRFVVGVITAKSPFGAWVDLGCGFPALLELPQVMGLTPEKYAADDWCPIGSILRGYVADFLDDNHQIRIQQVRSNLGA